MGRAVGGACRGWLGAGESGWVVEGGEGVACGEGGGAAERVGGRGRWRGLWACGERFGEDGSGGVRSRGTWRGWRAWRAGAWAVGLGPGLLGWMGGR